MFITVTVRPCCRELKHTNTIQLLSESDLHVARRCLARCREVAAPRALRAARCAMCPCHGPPFPARAAFSFGARKKKGIRTWAQRCGIEAAYSQRENWPQRHATGATNPHPKRPSLEANLKSLVKTCLGTPDFMLRNANS